MLGPLTLYFFGAQLFRFDMWKEDWKTSNHFHSFNTLMIKHYNLSIHKRYCCVFFSNVISNMSRLILYGYNSKKHDTTYQNIDFLFNLEQISRSSRNGKVILGFNVLIHCEMVKLHIWAQHWQIHCIQGTILYFYHMKL